MKIGVHVGNGGPWATPDTIAGVADRAESLGFDSVWVSDHVVVPTRIESTYPYGPPGTFTAETSQNYFEPFAVLAYVAGRTARVELGTTVLVVPQRPPLLIAKQWATLDALSGGRTILGIGAGWLREEFAALGADTFDARGKATDEAIQIFRKAWTEPGDVAFSGEVYSFEPVRVMPKPARPGGPPIWIGGHGTRSIRRAAERGNGWHPIRVTVDDLRAGIGILRDMLPTYGRAPEDVLISVVLNVYAPGTLPEGEQQEWQLAGDPAAMAATLRRYRDVGVAHVVLNPYPKDSLAGMLDALDLVARDVRPHVAE